MKLRVGYGKTGSTAIDPYMTQKSTNHRQDCYWKRERTLLLTQQYLSRRSEMGDDLAMGCRRGFGIL